MSPVAPYGLGDMDITGVDFIAVPTADYERASAFYGDVLGLPFVKRWGSMPAGEWQAGNLTIAVMQSDAFGREFRSSSTAVALQVDDVAATRAELEGKGVAFQGGDTMDSGVCHMAFFADPDGNPLILHHRYAPKEARPPAAAAAG
jgi:catechol 2,3-dioxygenase-like lactoylglutathione lyase family enzyme